MKAFARKHGHTKSIESVGALQGHSSRACITIGRPGIAVAATSTRSPSASNKEALGSALSTSRALRCEGAGKGSSDASLTKGSSDERAP